MRNLGLGNMNIFEIGTTKNKGSRKKVPATIRVFQYFDELEKLLISNGYRKKSLDLDNETMVMVDRNGNLMDEHAFGVNMVRYLFLRPLRYQAGPDRNALACPK